MIALDSSALIAIALKENERAAFAEAIANNRCLIGHATVLESQMVLRDRIGDSGVAFLDALLAQPHVSTIAFNDALLPIARLAFDQYGKGPHRAGLNFGDCLSYAVAKAHDLPLLYKGGDFALTDIRPALP